MKSIPKQNTFRFNPNQILNVFRSSVVFDLRSLAFLRISLALLLLVDLGSRVPDFATFYTDEGVLPRAFLLSQFTNPWRTSLYLISGTSAVTAALFFLAGVFAFCLLVGWRTRWTAFLSWFFISSLHLRNPMVTNSADHMLRYILFWSLFLPLGARYSLDALAHPNRPEKQVSGFASAAYVAQICLVYWSAALIKSYDAQWRSGEAIWCALNVGEFATPLGARMLNFPLALKFLTYYTMAFEAIAPFFLLMPARMGRLKAFMALAFIVLQTGFGAFLDVGLFPLVSSVAMIPLLSGWFHRELPEKGQRQPSALLRIGKAISGRWVHLGQALARILPPAPVKPEGLWASRASEGLALFLILYIFVWNVGAIYPRLAMPGAVSWIGYVTHLDQRWGMFVPAGTHTGWFVFQGEQKNGQKADVFQNTAPDFGRPVDFKKYYRNKSWKEYLSHLWDPAYVAHRPYLAWNLCQDWNGRHLEGEQVKRIDIYGVFENFYPAPQERQTAFIYSHACVKE